MGSTKDVLANIAKAGGNKSVVMGNEVSDVDRLPTDVFSFDLSSGGGFPLGKMSIVYGPESSGKTNLALKALASFQRLYPEQQAVFIDVENSFDSKWSRKMGVDVDKLPVIKPDYAEQVVDQVEALLKAEDIGLIIIDSLAAMLTIRELENSAEKANVGGATIAVTSLVKKITAGQSAAKKRDHYPTVICINQTRTAIGVMYGNPETMPCGAALRFMSGLTVRIYGKNTIVKEINANLPAYKETTTMIKKNKVPIVFSKSEYNMLMIPHGNLQVGDCDDFNLLYKHLRENNIIKKGEKGGWVLEGNEFKNLNECQTFLEEHPEVQKRLKEEIIEDAIQAVYAETTEQ